MIQLKMCKIYLILYSDFQDCLYPSYSMGTTQTMFVNCFSAMMLIRTLSIKYIVN